MLVEMFSGLVIFLMRALARGGAFLSAGKIVAVIVYYGIMFYFFYSVYSYFVLLKKQKRLERNALALGLNPGNFNEHKIFILSKLQCNEYILLK